MADTVGLNAESSGYSMEIPRGRIYTVSTYGTGVMVDVLTTTRSDAIAATATRNRKARLLMGTAW